MALAPSKQEPSCIFVAVGPVIRALEFNKADLGKSPEALRTKANGAHLRTPSEVAPIDDFAVQDQVLVSERIVEPGCRVAPVFTMSDYSISDELLAVNSIYGPDIEDSSSGLVSLSSPLYPDPSHPEDESFQILRVPHSAGVELRLHLDPVDYPGSTPPTVVGVVSSGSGTNAMGHGKEVLELVRGLLIDRFVPDQPVLFELLQALDERDSLRSEASDTKAGDGEDEGQQAGGVVTEKDSNDEVGGSGFDEGQDVSSNVVQWAGSGAVMEKKSVFVAHACTVSSAVEAKRNVALLIASDRKFSKATHNISAFRGHLSSKPSNGKGLGGGKESDNEGSRKLIFQDCDDDGEDAAGGRLLHLLELTGSYNVLVVVSRWYGGVKLGPDRFRIINQVARDALVRGGWIKEGEQKAHKRGK